jgi:KH domain
VRLRGEPTLVKKLKAELEKSTADLRDRVILGVQIPAAAHSSLIGRGGRNLTNFQNKFNVQVQYPGSNSYKYTSEPENAEELGDVPPEELVKVAGARESVGEAIEHLKVCCRYQASGRAHAAAVAGYQCRLAGECDGHHRNSTEVPRCLDIARRNFPHSSFFRCGCRAFRAAH